MKFSRGSLSYFINYVNELYPNPLDAILTDKVSQLGRQFVLKNPQISLIFTQFPQPPQIDFPQKDSSH